MQFFHWKLYVTVNTRLTRAYAHARTHVRMHTQMHIPAHTQYSHSSNWTYSKTDTRQLEFSAENFSIPTNPGNPDTVFYVFKIRDLRFPCFFHDIVVLFLGACIEIFHQQSFLEFQNQQMKKYIIVALLTHHIQPASFRWKIIPFTSLKWDSPLLPSRRYQYFNSWRFDCDT